MKRIVPVVTYLLLGAGLLFARQPVASQPQTGPTAVCGSLAANDTWTPAGSPYVVCANFGFTIPAHLTLTIQPGVSVQLPSGNGEHIYVEGTLAANGTAANHITFGAVNSASGVWGGIDVAGSLQTPAQVSLDYVDLSYAGAASSSEGALYAGDAVVTIDHSTFDHGAGNGLYFAPSVQFTLNRASFTNNGFDPVVLGSPSGKDLLMSGLSASGNGANVVFVSSTTLMNGVREWTNPGIPYFMDGNVYNQAGDALTIDPGATLEFGPSGALTIGGQLNALGTSTDPITMTRQANTSGFWRGIVVLGGSQLANAQLDYVTVEYAGDDINGADIDVGNGNLIVHHSIIQNSQKDGVRFEAHAGGVILQSQVSGNALYGVRNIALNQAVDAAQNYWGTADGPTSDLNSCPVGHGDKVTSNVLFLPVRASAGEAVPLALSNAPILTLTPRAWIVAADGSRVFIDIKLTDGNGYPLVGRQINITSSLGQATGGGITDVFGNTSAYVSSTTVGDATITAQVNGTTACEPVPSPQTKISFTPPISGPNLFLGGRAPYSTKAISVKPEPVTTGVTTTITANLANPTSSPVTVDVTFGFAQSGIGLEFGPIKQYQGQVVPANGSLTLTASFVPIVSGHYCVRVSYTITAIGAVTQAPLNDPSQDQNENVHQSTTGNKDKEDGLNKTKNSLKVVNAFTKAAYNPNPAAVPLAVANAGIGMELKWASQIDQAEKGDPPALDYMQISTPQVVSLPKTVAGAGMTQAHAGALNALQDSIEQATAYGHAATIALDRMGGASAAQDLQWASTQAGVMQEYNQLYGAALVTSADKIDALVSELATEGVTSVVMTTDQVIAMQADLSANGFPQAEIDDAHALGMTDADLAAFKVEILSARPEDLAGDLIFNMQQIGRNFRDLGYTLEHPDNFAPGYSVSGGLAASTVQAGNQMVQVHDVTSTVQIANPTSQPATINLSVRPINLPAGWSADVTPAQVTLAPLSQDPNALAAVTVTIHPGGPVPQGIDPTVAVEGSINGQFIGGVEVVVVVPRYAPFDGNLRLFLPEVQK